MTASTRIFGMACAGLLLFGVGAAAEDENAFEAPDRSVTLDAPTTARMGITTVAAQEMQYHAEAHGLGQVLPVDAIAQTDADLTTAEAAAQASQAALVRAHGLFGADNSVSRQALETAEHQAAADAAQLALAQRKSMAAWGPDTPWRDSKERAALIAKLASGDMAIVRATFPAGTMGDAPPAVMQVQPLDAPEGAKGWTATNLWRAPADPAVPGPSFFMLVEGAHGLVQGEHVRVSATVGEGKRGAAIPADSVIVAEGRTWLYIEEKPDYFVRQAIDLSEPTSDGYFLSQGVQPGESVVNQGAGQLLARETGTED